MSEDRPSTADLGITSKDRNGNVERSSEVVLPSPPDRGMLSPITGEPAPNYHFNREQEMPPQEQFSDRVKDIVVIPIRAELKNGNLAKRLRELNAQRGFNHDKLGVVLLVNDNAKDKEQRQNILEENRDTTRYVALLSAKDMEEIEQMDIPDEAKKMAKEILEQGKLEIRSDHLHFSYKFPDFGALRIHLFKLAAAFKNKSVRDEDVIVHLSDIDTGYSPLHFQKLKAFYKDSTHEANFTEEDFLPGVHEGAGPGIHEGENDEDISRDLLATLDEYRLYRYGADIATFLTGKIASGSPVISGRLSLFFENGQLDPDLVDIGHNNIINEDWAIGAFIRNREIFAKTVGNVGEVYFLHRSRKPSSIGGDALTDAEGSFNAVQQIKEGKIGPYSFDQGDEYIEYIENMIARSRNQSTPDDSHSENFKESEEYKELLRTELRKEQIKVRLRRMRLMNYVDSLAGKKALGEHEEEILDPYMQYFEDETDAMKQQLAKGKTPEQVVVSYIHKYESFFDSDAPIHVQIARLRTLKRYAFAHDLKDYVAEERRAKIRERVLQNLK